jgi:leucyl aminopeptidase
LAARLTPEAADVVPIWFVSPENWDEVRGAIGETSTRFAAACGFEPKPGRLQLLPDASGGLAGALFGQAGANGGDRDPLAPGKLATALPAGDWRFANSPQDAELATLGFLLGLYRFDRFKVDASTQPRLAAPAGVDGEDVERVAAAVAFGRDLVNVPANILGPAALESAATELAQAFDASVETIRGVELLGKNLPLIHAVGAAAFEAPRLVDFVWGRADAPKLTLVGKGVVFDTGGLDIKPANGMELMKKDMGGAATALTLARLVMESALDVRLRILIPIVENSISARAMRPGDILKSRKGLTVEIGNTDAEGRLILADALALAAEEAPDLIFDFATLTGAARVALGPDLPPFYTDDEALARDIAHHVLRVRDPVWRLPLWRPYDSMMESPFADLNNAPGNPFAGSVTAALFLRRFAEGAKSWAHFDVYAWNPKPRAHGPQGGEIQSARALFDLLRTRFRGRGKPPLPASLWGEMLWGGRRE